MGLFCFFCLYTKAAAVFIGFESCSACWGCLGEKCAWEGVGFEETIRFSLRNPLSKKVPWNCLVWNLLFLNVKLFLLKILAIYFYYWLSLNLCAYNTHCIHLYSWKHHCTKKRSFLLRISSVNVTKSAVSCGFGHIYWRNS